MTDRWWSWTVVVWVVVGQVGPLNNPKDGHFDPEKSEFGEGQVYDFPPNDDCDKVYCNIEG